MQYIGFSAFTFIFLTLINRVCEGRFILSADTDIINTVLAFKDINVFNLFTIPVPNMEFITTGLPHLIKWDYSFFGGTASIISYALYSVTAFISFLLFTVIVGLLYSYFTKP